MRQRHRAAKREIPFALRQRRCWGTASVTAHRGENDGVPIEIARRLGRVGKGVIMHTDDAELWPAHPALRETTLRRRREKYQHARPARRNQGAELTHAPKAPIDARRSGVRSAGLTSQIEASDDPDVAQITRRPIVVDAPRRDRGRGRHQVIVRPAGTVDHITDGTIVPAILVPATSSPCTHLCRHPVGQQERKPTPFPRWNGGIALCGSEELGGGFRTTSPRADTRQGVHVRQRENGTQC